MKILLSSVHFESAKQSEDNQVDPKNSNPSEKYEKKKEAFNFHEDITQLEQKNSSPWYTCDLSPHRVLAMSVHYF